MSTKIGLDFGTHQTKVCIMDNSDRRNRNYSFFRFRDLMGNEQLTLPSIVQLNNDGTLSYGYTDVEKARQIEAPIPANAPPRPVEPVLVKYTEYPQIPKPVRPSILDESKSFYENVARSFSDLMSVISRKQEDDGKSFKVRQKEAKLQYEEDCRKYTQECRKREDLISQNKISVDKTNEELRQKYKNDLRHYEQWMSDNRKKSPFIYYYFKQTVFSSGVTWNHAVSAMDVSVWYLTYVFFLLDKVYGTQNLVVSMGTSSGVDSWESNKRKATEIILTVYDLIERVYEHDMDKFLSATVDDLKKVTQLVKYSHKLKEENAIYVFPEAYANLQPLAQRKAFAGGVNLLVDIGGGTTDISLFVAPYGEDVHVYDYQSVPYGINSIKQNGMEPHFNAISQVVLEFTKKLEGYAYSINAPAKEVSKIAKRRNVIFTGGGSVKEKLIRPYHGFSEVMKFKDRFFNLMPVNNIEGNVENEIHVLSTALGLAMAKEDDSKIPMHSYSQLFDKVAEVYNKNRFQSGGDRYEHGLTDL